MAHNAHEHRGTDLREPRPSKSRVGVSYTTWREGSAWIERRVKEISGLEGREERDDDR